jgi:hypothetical protein
LAGFGTLLGSGKTLAEMGALVGKPAIAAKAAAKMP